MCRHTTAACYAAALCVRGVPVRISEDGWAASSVVQAACAALSYAANPANIHPGLALRTLGPEPLDLQYALASQMDGVLADDAILIISQDCPPALPVCPFPLRLIWCWMVQGFGPRACPKLPKRAPIFECQTL